MVDPAKGQPGDRPLPGVQGKREMDGVDGRVEGLKYSFVPVSVAEMKWKSSPAAAV